MRTASFLIGAGIVGLGYWLLKNKVATAQPPNTKALAFIEVHATVASDDGSNATAKFSNALVKAPALINACSAIQVGQLISSGYASTPDPHYNTVGALYEATFPSSFPASGGPLRPEDARCILDAINMAGGVHVQSVKSFSAVAR